MPDLVLVTGGSGFIAGHCILNLVAAGHRVRATIRTTTRAPDALAALRRAGLPDDSGLEFVAADLTDDAGWTDAMAGVDGVLHVASPVRPGRVRNPDDVIGPAREGTLRVLRAARAAELGRVVVTSAFHAAGFGHPHTHGSFTEDDWSVLDGPGMDAYGASKVLAERAAWDFADSGAGPELVTLLPVAVMGPVIGSGVSGANHVVQRLLNGQLPGYPNLYLPIVDVRDVAAAHVRALTAPDAAGQRILIGSGEPAIALGAIGSLLRDEFGDAAAKVPSRNIPDFVVRLGGLFNPEFRTTAAELGFVKQVSIDKARRVLGFHPRPAREAILAAAASMIERPAG